MENIKDIQNNGKRSKKTGDANADKPKSRVGIVSIPLTPRTALVSNGTSQAKMTNSRVALLPNLSKNAW